MRVDVRTRETILDVIVRLREHDQYGESRERALKAFRRRCPDLSAKRSERVFDFFDALHAETIEVVRALPPLKSKSVHETVAQLFEAALVELRRRRPHETRRVLATFVNWVVYWHVLR